MDPSIESQPSTPKLKAHAKYYAAHRDAILERSKEYYARTKEARKDHVKQYYNQNIEERRRYGREYMKKRRDALKATTTTDDN